MNSEYLFKMALGINLPWKIIDVKLDNLKSGKELNIHTKIKDGAEAPIRLVGLTGREQGDE